MKHDNTLTYEIKQKTDNIIYTLTEPLSDVNINNYQNHASNQSNHFNQHSLNKSGSLKNHNFKDNRFNCHSHNNLLIKNPNVKCLSLSHMPDESVSSFENSIYIENELLKKDIDILIKQLNTKNKEIEDLSNRLNEKEKNKLCSCSNTESINQYGEGSHLFNEAIEIYNNEMIKTKDDYEELENQYKEQSVINIDLKRTNLELKEKSILKEILEEKLLDFEKKILFKDSQVDKLHDQNKELIKKIEELTLEIKRVKKHRIQLNNYICSIESNFRNKAINSKDLNYQITQCNNLTFNKINLNKHIRKIQKVFQFSLSRNDMIINKEKQFNSFNYKIESYNVNNTIKHRGFNTLNQTKFFHCKHKERNDDDDINDLLFTPFDKNTMLAFNYKTQSFTSYSFADYSNYEDNFLLNNTLYYTNKGDMYIITGKAANLLYYYSHSKNSIVKKSNLNDNHLKGKLMYIPNYDKFICLSGCFNRKVEQYDPIKNKWEYSPEMLIERCEAAFTLINDNDIYAFFGYNNPTNSYINDIEYLSYSKNDKWIRINVSSIEPIKLKGHTTFQLTKDISKVLIVGGENSIQANIYFAEIDIDTKTVEYKDRQFKDIIKNKKYMFNKSIPININDDNESLIIYDDKINMHWLNSKTLLHDVFAYDI